MSEYSGSSVRMYGNILFKSFSSMAQISIQLYKYYPGHKTINILLNIAGNKVLYTDHHSLLPLTSLH